MHAEGAIMRVNCPDQGWEPERRVCMHIMAPSKGIILHKAIATISHRLMSVRSRPRVKSRQESRREISVYNRPIYIEL